MAQGPIDHPAYLTRQILNLGATTAGTSGTSTTYLALPWDVNIHNVVAVVKTAGTATGHLVTLMTGTSTIAGSTVTLSTSTAGVVGTSGNVAAKIVANTPILVKNGTDGTGVAQVLIEFNIAPDTGTWLGNE